MIPYQPKPGKSLAENCPDLIEAWSSLNNYKPSQVGIGSKYKALWVCTMHGDYRMTVANRVFGKGCPKCGLLKRSKSRATPKKGKSLGDLYPELVKEWSSENSKSIFEVNPSANYRAKWICSQGHKWEAPCDRRAGSGKGCIKCGNKRSGIIRSTPPREKSLAYLYPNLASEWSAKNNITPDKVYSGSPTEYYWTCPEGHGEYLASCWTKTQGFLVCKECRYGKSSRTRSTPSHKKSLGYLYPDLISEWSDKNKKSIFEVNPSTKYKAIWICPIHGDYEATCNSRISHKTGCKYCGIKKSAKTRSLPKPFHSFADLYPDLLKEYSPENDRNPYSLNVGADYLAKWVCKDCGYTWNTYVYCRTGPNKTGCPHCCNKVSEPEQLLRESLISYGASSDSQTKIDPWKVDIYIPSSKTIIEYDGSRWHSFEGCVERDRRKSLNLLSQGYRVIRIRELSTSYQLGSLGIEDKNYHEIFYENGLNEAYRKEPTEDLLRSLQAVL